MLFADNDQQNKYHQVWKEILKIINGGHGELKLHEKIKLFDTDFPIEKWKSTGIFNYSDYYSMKGIEDTKKEMPTLKNDERMYVYL